MEPIHMRKIISGVLLACMACAGAMAAEAEKHYGSNVSISVDGKTAGHQAVAEFGKKVSITTTREGQPIRMDYVVTRIEVGDKDNPTDKPLSRITGKVFVPEKGDAWQVASEFSVMAQTGQPFHFEKRGDRFHTSIDMTVTPMTDEQVREKQADTFKKAA